MSDAAIRIEGIGKQFRLGQAQQRYPTLRDVLAGSAQRAARALRSPGRGARPEPDTLWALRGVTFQVARGEVVGIIGGNGAGKSTLLKILSRITEPTEGDAWIHGRVGSLLEVGTGFHPELTGRENVYLNGAIMGMTRREITGKFDEIVAFAEVERFIDTAVKHYSSGMYLRLAFAVAAHLEPEILIVDEVLAVGDASFQKKCLRKMGDVASEGRTVLFVSHNMDAVQRLCVRCVLLEKGSVAMVGRPAEVISRYLSADRERGGPDTWLDLSGAARTGSGGIRFRAARYGTGQGGPVRHPHPNGPLEVVLRIDSDADRSVESLAVTVYDRFGNKLVNADTVTTGEPVRLTRGENVMRVAIDQLHLNPGTYVVGLWTADSLGMPFDHLESAFDVDVVQGEVKGFGTRPRSDGIIPCAFSVTEVPARAEAPLRHPAANG